jgi:chromosome segregation ATPase
MARKITDDQINLEVLMNTSDAQKSIDQLNGSIRQSQAVIREHRKALTDLVAQGKQNTDEYRRLEQAVKDERAAIKLNTAELKKQTDALDLNQLSMNQLRKRASNLKRELDRLVRANDPDKRDAINRKYQETVAYMGELKDKVRETGMSLTDIFRRHLTSSTVRIC